MVGRVRVRQIVDVGQQLDPGPVQALCRLVPIGDQAVLEVEELALDLAVGHRRFLLGPDDDHAFPAVHDHQVAAAGVVHDPFHARDRGNSPAPRQDRGVAGRSADLGHDPGDRQVTQAHRLAGQDLVGHQDHRLLAVMRLDGAVGNRLLLP